MVEPTRAPAHGDEVEALTRVQLARSLRRYGLLFGAVFVLLAAFIAVRAAHPPEATPRAKTSVVILPDPRPPISWVSPVVPAYQTFKTKLASIEANDVRTRAAELALGVERFDSLEWETPHLREGIEAGVHLLRVHYGEGENAVPALAESLARRVTTRHVERRQIVEISVEADSPLEAKFLSWALAEAAHQVHRERMLREVVEVRTRLEAEIAQTRARLIELWSTRDDFPELTRLSLDLRRQLIHELSTELTEEELSLEVALARNRAGFPRDGVSEDFAWAGDRADLERIALAERAEYIARAAVLGPVHPDLRRHERRIADVRRRLEEFDAAEPMREARAVHASLHREREEYSVELSALRDRRAVLEEDVREWTAAMHALALDSRESRRLREQFEHLTGLSNRVKWFGESLGSPIVVLSPASRIDRPEGAVRPWFVIGSALLLTLFGFAGFLVILDRAAVGYRSRRDVERGLDLPMLGVIPEERELPLDLLETGPTPATAGIDALAATLRDSAGATRLRTIAIASSEKGEGKTTTAIRLAASLARRGIRVALIDGDLRQPMIGRTLGLEEGEGIATCLVDARDAEDARVEVPRLASTRIPNLHVLTARAIDRSQIPVLRETRLGALFSELRKDHDLLIIDTPAVSRAGDALSIGRLTDGVVLVARAFATPRRAVDRARVLLSRSGSIALGVVLTRFPHTPAGAFAPEPHVGTILTEERTEDRTTVEA